MRDGDIFEERMGKAKVTFCPVLLNVGIGSCDNSRDDHFPLKRFAMFLYPDFVGSIRDKH